MVEGVPRSQKPMWKMTIWALVAFLVFIAIVLAVGRRRGEPAQDSRSPYSPTPAATQAVPTPATGG